MAAVDGRGAATAELAAPRLPTNRAAAIPSKLIKRFTFIFTNPFGVLAEAVTTNYSSIAWSAD
ncbi:hypothetical protein ABT255_50590 [Streptomyces mirabilis]|uniref:hypothetical protein n=1 Tax=Streptomyces mirabilis TaxID=68239 RepID=UPI00331D6853